MSNRINFTFLTGDMDWRDYGGKWVSKRFNNGDFDYWLVRDFINMHHAVGDDVSYSYIVAIYAVSPQEAGTKNLKQALEYIGLEDRPLDSLSDIEKVLALTEYGVQAHLWDTSGNNSKKLLKAANTEARNIEFLFGFYMDKQENAIGNTGWDFIKGDIVYK